MKPQVEILAPAGSMESMVAAINAGADAVYMGGSRFGARAYADNPEEERLLEAIDYAHLHGRKLYMTVNTLVKPDELNQLFDFLNPCYVQGLDAVIVQDLGVWEFVRRKFPELPIHASTQMTVTGYRSAKLLKELGVSRVVTARELSLEELAQIHEKADVEVESFIHGALCYCYSGQCLLSSLIGGRSGNRGRCAQPCRLPYEVTGEKQSGNHHKNHDRYLLSMKDLCTLDILPDIIDAGVYSLKIEGRMKSPRYTAGVVSIYRKYVDYYLERGRGGYHVEPGDRQMLLDLFDRGGFSDGYYETYNGREMMALKEKPSFRKTDQTLLERLDAEYVNKRKQEPVCGHVLACEGQPVRLELVSGDVRAVAEGDVVQTAQNQPLTEEKLLKQINKTGNSPFFFQELTAEIKGHGFLPVQSLNELRRKGFETLTEAVLSPYRRQQNIVKSSIGGAVILSSNQKSGTRLHVSLEEPETLKTVLESPDVDEVYLDTAGFGAELWAESVNACHNAGKRCGLLLPHIFRTHAEQYLTAHSQELRTAGFDEMVLRSLDEIVFLREQGLEGISMVSDANLYVMNHLAAFQMTRAGISRMTLPFELNSRELEEIGCEGMELVVYGHLPAMVSAQCIVRTTKGCTKKPELLKMRDRMGKEIPVKNHCRFCCNTIYNPTPLSLLGQEKLVKRLNPSVLRLSFTMETPRQTAEIIGAFADGFLRGKKTSPPFSDFTRGHFKRGVE